MRRPLLAFGTVIPVLLGVASWSGGAQKRQAAAVPSGTQLQVRLNDKLDTGEARPGQSFSATVAQPVVVAGRTVLARGAKVTGRVTEAVSSGRLKQPASITLELTQAAGASVATQSLRIDGRSHLVRNAELIGGGTAAGALIGAVAGGKKGAAIGAAVGAGAGATTAYMTGKKEIVLPVETLLTFVVSGGGGRGAEATTSRGQPESAGRSYQPSGGGERASEAGISPGGTREAATVPTFSERDQEEIRRYYRMNTANVPPGLAKRGVNLPPGLERHLERNGTLPPGLQKRVEPFPEQLNQQLAPLPAGYSRVTLAGRAMILDRANKIVDLMFVNK